MNKTKIKDTIPNISVVILKAKVAILAVNKTPIKNTNNATAKDNANKKTTITTTRKINFTLLRIIKKNKLVIPTKMEKIINGLYFQLTLLE